MTHYQYVPARTAHLLHFLLSCVTLGLWVPVWIVLTIHNHNRMVTRPLPQATVDQAAAYYYGQYPHPRVPHYYNNPTPPSLPQE